MRCAFSFPIIGQGKRRVMRLAACLPQQWIGHQYTLQYQRRASLSTARTVIFSGIQPTGVPHLGNYLGALQQWVRIQNEAKATSTLMFSIVDLHAMTLPYDQNQLRLWKRQTLAALLAVGLKPEQSTIFFQSAVRLGSILRSPLKRL